MQQAIMVELLIELQQNVNEIAALPIKSTMKLLIELQQNVNWVNDVETELRKLLLIELQQNVNAVHKAMKLSKDIAFNRTTVECK